jgi:uncharacterized protein YggT (Ycf19 family)
MNAVLFTFIDLLFKIFSFLILVDILGSWLLAARLNLPGFVYQILGAVHAIVEPILAPFRRIIPPIGGLDFSAMIALVVLNMLQRLLYSALGGGF